MSDLTKLEQQLRAILEGRDPADRGRLDQIFDTLWKAAGPHTHAEEADQLAYERGYVSLLRMYDDSALQRLLGETAFAKDISRFGWRPLRWREGDPFQKWKGALLRFAKERLRASEKRDAKHEEYNPLASYARGEGEKAVSAALVDRVRTEIADDRSIFVSLLRDVEGVPWDDVAARLGHSVVHCRRLRNKFLKALTRLEIEVRGPVSVHLYESVLDDRATALAAPRGQSGAAKGGHPPRSRGGNPPSGTLGAQWQRWQEKGRENVS